MAKKFHISIYRLAIVIASTGLSIGCNNKFESSKLDFISKTSVFGYENFDKSVIQTESSEVAIDVSVGGAKNDPILLNLSLQCSTNASGDGGNLLSNPNAEIEIEDTTGKGVCKITSADYDIIDFVSKNKKIDLAKCRETLKDSLEYQLAINSLDQTNKFVKKLGSGSIKLKNGQIQPGNAVIWVLFNYNFVTKKPTDPNIANNPKFTSQVSKCDQNASPLVIDMRSNTNSARGIELTSLIDGVMFDILGQRSSPRPHTKIQISWITHSQYMFLVRPNQNGEVKGIDELFGDNTMGPDGKFTSDGFAALAKYDINQDKVINLNDAVFEELRLWSDVNLDGVAEKNELITLSEAGVSEFDLDYDPTFREVDQFGNETKLKSIVRFVNGEMRLIFDLWFRYNLD